MKPLMNRLLTNPAFRILALLIGATLIWMVWDEFQQNRTRYAVTVSSLPSEWGSHIKVSPGGDAIAGCAEGELIIAPLNPEASPTMEEARLIPLPDDAACSPFHWSPDGTRLLMPYSLPDESDGAAGGLLVIAPSEEVPVEVFALEGGVDPNIQPAWSPDGRHVAYLGGLHTETFGGLWLLDLETARTNRLHLGVILSPAFSPDSQTVYFLEDTRLASRTYDEEMDDYPHVWTLGAIPVDGGEVTRLAEWTQGSFMPSNAQLVAVHPDGVQYLRYFRVNPENNRVGSRLEVWDWSEGQNTRQATIQLEPAHLAGGLRFSPNRDWVTFLTFRTRQGPNHLMLCHLTREITRRARIRGQAPDVVPEGLASTGLYWIEPEFGPDGETLTATLAAVVQTAGADAPGHEGHGHEGEPHFEVHLENAQPVLLKLPGR